MVRFVRGSSVGFVCADTPTSRRMQRQLTYSIHRTWGKYASWLAVAAFFSVFSAKNALSQDLGNIEEIKPISLDGSISISGSKYSVSGAPRRRPPTSWTLIGSPTLSIYGVSLPFNFILSDQESDFRQPFDQIGVSPQYKSVTLHLGYRSLTYSKYTLAGISFLGAGLDLNPNPLRFSIMYRSFPTGCRRRHHQHFGTACIQKNGALLQKSVSVRRQVFLM